jgi:hypothetical protein
MTIAIQPIYTQNIGDGSISGISFNNIPQTFTDLLVLISVRSKAGGADSLGLVVNGVNNNRSRTMLTGDGSSAASNRSTYRDIAGTPGTPQTSNTFSNVSIYIPNYSSTSNFKQIISDGVWENNATSNSLTLSAWLSQQTSAITSLGFDNSTSGMGYAQYSSFSLYGITRG